MKENGLKDKFSELIEKYRFAIGGGLIILILIGTVILLWRDNYSKPKTDNNAVLESKISQLQKEIDSMKLQITESKSQINSNSQNSNLSNGSGQVAGASSQSPNSINKIQKQAQDDSKININTASTTELDSLPGIGATYAQRIIDYRNSHGGFKNIDEVKNVKGIGEKTFEKFKDKIAVN